MTIAYLANSFPESQEPYVWEEICELRRHGQLVLPCSFKRPRSPSAPEAARQTLYILPLRLSPCAHAIWALVRKFSSIKKFIRRAVLGSEPVTRGLRALVHTWLGVYLATALRNKNIRHIHVHHGYFAAWAGMVAAKLLGADFSMTLHGSDLLLRADYLDMKLKYCRFCITISEFNRQYIRRHFPEIQPNKLLVHRLGVDTSAWRNAYRPATNTVPLILSVGRLNAVKNYPFLILACRLLQSSGTTFHCSIAGEGPERARLEQLIAALGLDHEVDLLGHIAREQLPELYAQADVVVLTSRSEGIPLALMEAMSMEKLVLAPDITGIPELVREGETGFLYPPNSMEDFLQKLQFLVNSGRFLNRVRRAARRQVERDFNNACNLKAFAEDFLNRLAADRESLLIAAGRKANEDTILQQI